MNSMSSLEQFRKKPVVVEAIRFRGDNMDEIRSWAKDLSLCWPSGWEFVTDEAAAKNVVLIPTLEGLMRANAGDYLIRGVKGEFYPCKADIFSATYEPVTQAAPISPRQDELELAKALDIFYCEDLAEEGAPWEVPAEPEPSYFATLSEATIFLVNLLKSECDKLEKAVTLTPSSKEKV